MRMMSIPALTMCEESPGCKQDLQLNKVQNVVDIVTEDD